MATERDRAHRRQDSRYRIWQRAWEPFSELRDEMATEAEGPFGSSTRPHRAERDTNRRKNRHMKYSQDALGQFFCLLKLQCHSTETQIEDPRTAAALLADDRVSISARHRDALCFALDGVGSVTRRVGRSLIGNGVRGGGRSGVEFGRWLIRRAASGDRNGQSWRLSGRGIRCAGSP